MSTITAPRHGQKRSTNVYLSVALVEKARSFDMNLSATLDALLAQAIEEIQRKRQQEKADMQAMNAFMEKVGTITDDDFFGGL
ncbi:MULTISPECIES: type II toxin-antitoxin system CcdA family antitoxin [Tenebrionibacter/Tenebrionicola group]|jgi:antitoxin CcdA|uniref:Type II toxin-antitoxin system CcdA family antitoxin n=2 Tax=Tenebrionibacter/Tenebrionicola group TaxID=2969848 RepID=A0A8K0V6M7_9ENTR|nr:MULTISPECIES: type II toxin-antitoxin system CcdA family antitoxin [Tenebrionibacter/Tenebrionicola group]MBK4715152.1 type II toxin-antitoxin system CcdA family antitoxin [Tenebrionibacter intestinalis]MBV4413638.1 type II toxin-antitoxin system CcdA family antitoxin [Tenebrionicola larvae]MBV5095883.1 type II toxin-antitoxin system CcdA family antitoxin [Tenebrionicola larvae]